MTNTDLSQINEFISSENISKTIRGLVEKYGLEKDIEEEKEVKKRLEKIEDPAAREAIKFLSSKKFAEQLKKGESLDELFPFRKLKKIIKEIIENKISFEELPLILQERFNMPSKDSKGLAKDIEKSFSFLIREKLPKILGEEKISPLPKEVPSVEKKASEDDTCREPIE